MNIEIRRAVMTDADRLLELLAQVEQLHHEGRPDIFRENGVKFTRDELLQLLCDETKPVFVAEADGRVVGYTFCILGEISNSPMLNDARTLHLEDVCVDESCRGMAVGSALIEHVREYARGVGCTRMDLDVWEFNEGARRFYEKHGFSVQKRRMDMPI